MIPFLITHRTVEKGRLIRNFSKIFDNRVFLEYSIIPQVDLIHQTVFSFLIDIEPKSVDCS